MKTATNATWRAAAATAVNRVLKRIDDSARTPAPVAHVPAPAYQPVAAEKVDLPPLDFVTGEPVTVEAAPAPAPAAKAAEAPPSPPPVEFVSLLEDPAQQRIRDDYVAARFPGVARNSHDLARSRAVIKAAQVYMEDGDSSRAEELLDLAALLQPSSEALLLARLEVALQQRDSEGYRRTAIRFHHAHPRSAHWKYIVAFARTLYLTEPPFTTLSDWEERNYQRPNWMGNSWELAPEFNNADLRRRVLGAAPAQEPQPEAERMAA